MPEPSTADLMRQWRAAAGLSRADAAARLRMAPGTLRDIEQGLSRTDDVLAQIALKKLIADAK
jgi:transcriptional regulator with XRE-family HTH domain